MLLLYHSFQVTFNHDFSQELSKSLIVSTCRNHSVVEVLNILESLGFKDIIVRSLSSKKFLLTFKDFNSLENTDVELLGLGFLSCEAASIEDTVIPRIAYIRCLGLPLNLCSTNLVKQHGKLVGISPLMDSEFCFSLRNPVLKVATFQSDKVRFTHEVCFEGQSFTVYGNEIKTDLLDWEFEDISSSNYSDNEEKDSLFQERKKSSSTLIEMRKTT